METLFIFILGIFFGSFANVCIRRIPYGNSIVNPPSHCPKCLIPIRWRDNIPVVSYILLKAKCRVCRNPISFQYPLVELTTGAFFLFSYLRFGLSAMFPISLVLGFLLIVISFIDFNLRVIPDVITLLLAAAGLAFSTHNVLVGRSFIVSFAGILAGGIAIYVIAFVGKKIYKKEVMGGGDVKLLAAGGSFLGPGVLYALLIATFLGAFFGVMSVLFKRKKLSDFVPFGPYIALGILLMFFFRDFFAGLFSLFIVG